MDRDAFLARVRRAAVAGRAFRVAVDDIPTSAGYVGASGDLCQALADEIAFVGGIPQRVPDWEAARAWIADLLQTYSVKSALCWNHPVLDRLRIADLLRECGVVTIDHTRLSSLGEDARRAEILGADLGITSVDYAIAETGSLAVAGQRGQERLSSLIAPVHLAIVARDQILPDLFDFFQRCEARGWDQLPSAWALISGPSKTGDIELELTTGIHGPGKWHVLVVDQPILPVS